MNKWCGVGRLTKDPEVKLTQNQTQFCNFTVAVDRRFKDSNGQRQADFINCVAWQKTAQFIQKYFKKGSRIGIVGCIQTRNFEDQNGQKVYITEVLAEEVEFIENKAEGQNAVKEQPEKEQPAQPEQEQSVENGEISADLPFEI